MSPSPSSRHRPWPTKHCCSAMRRSPEPRRWPRLPAEPAWGDNAATPYRTGARLNAAAEALAAAGSCFRRLLRAPRTFAVQHVLAGVARVFGETLAHIASLVNPCLALDGWVEGDDTPLRDPGQESHEPSS